LVAHHALMAGPAIRNDVQVPCACPAGAHTRVRHLELNLYDSARRRQGFVGWWRALAECAAATMISWVLLRRTHSRQVLSQFSFSQCAHMCNSQACRVAGVR
jgi:hypothetical protein